MTPGVGIAPTYTISRVILSDAVCLVRGDRFYTVGKFLLLHHNYFNSCIFCIPRGTINDT